MLNALKTILSILVVGTIVIAVILGGVYAVSFCWYSAKYVVLVNENAELLNHITITDAN